MSIRKILSMVIVVCLLATQVATVAFAEEIPAETIETIEGTAEQEETKAEAAEEKEEEAEGVKAEEAGASADIILTAELDDVIVTLKADKDAFENEGELSFAVKPVEIEDTEEEAALDAVEKENVAKRVTYDITVLDDGEKIEPVKEVKVSFELKDAPSGADGVNIYHHDEEEGIEKIASQVLKDDAKEETAKVGETKAEKDIEIKEVAEEELADTDDVAIIDDVTVDSFSLYTVDFTYKDKTISIAGDSTGNKLDDIVSQLGIKEEVTEATAYQDEECTEEADNNEVKNSDGETLYSVYEEGDTWYVDAVNAFQTEHGLVVKTADGAEYKIKVTDAVNWLSFTANEDDVKIQLNKHIEAPALTGGLEYSFNGTSWNDFKIGTSLGDGVGLANAGDKVFIRAKAPNSAFATNDGPYYYSHTFVIDKKVSADGDIRTLLDKDCPDNTLPDYCFAQLFKDCANLTTAPKLNSTKLSKGCYAEMFYACTSLTAAPALPATIMKDKCYEDMFRSCENLTTAPALPAETLANRCYAYMFQNCTNLATTPALPAETLAESCYRSMFRECINLTTAPILSATTLADDCCSCMFYQCTNLTTAPALPATIMKDSCYESMFNGCKNLTTAPALPATIMKDSCYESMFSGCEKLTTAPALPATIMKDRCYAAMFSGCEKMTIAPALPATTLADGCYQYMFAGCINLTTVPALPALTLKTDCYSAMFEGCSSLYVSTTNQDGLGIMMNTGGMSDSDLASCAHNMFDGILNITELGGATPKPGNVYYAKVVTTPLTPYVPSSSGGSSSSYAQGWRQSGTNWQYVKPNGAYAKNEWLQIDGKWYHFGNDAMMDTGWLLDTDGSWYYLSKEKGQNEGVMQTGWITDPDDGYRYYLDPATGKMLIGLHVIDGKSYYLTEIVTAPSGWTQNANGDWVYEKRDVIPLGAMK